MKIYLFILFFFFLNSQTGLFAQDLNNKELGKILVSESVIADGELGNWHCVFKEIPIFVLTDESANRLRIFTPILEEKELKIGQMKAMLEANFNSALDAKYSLYEGFVISVFTHPLRELSKEQVVNAMEQVINLSNTFGSTYSSLNAHFSTKKSIEKKVLKKS